MGTYIGSGFFSAKERMKGIYASDYAMHDDPSNLSLCPDSFRIVNSRMNMFFPPAVRRGNALGWTGGYLKFVQLLRR